MGFTPGLWAQPARKATARRKGFVAAGTLHAADVPATKRLFASVYRRKGGNRTAPNRRRKSSVTTSSESSSAEMSSVSAGSRSITIESDGVVEEEQSRLTPSELGDANLHNRDAPHMADMRSPWDPRYCYSPDSIYEHTPPLASTVNRRKSRRTKFIGAAKPATAPPSRSVGRRPSHVLSMIDESLSEAESDEPSWYSGSGNGVPSLTPDTIASTTTADSKILVQANKALPDTPGFSCPGCLIGGRAPRISGRDTPRDRHKGSLQYPEERESGFCNACRQGDLLPSMNRFTIVEPERTGLAGCGLSRAQIVRNEVRVNEDEAGNIVPHALLDSKFRLGATKESALAGRRRLLEADVDSLLSVSAPSEGTASITNHVAECKLQDSPWSNSGEPPSIRATIQQLRSPLSHSSLSSKDSSKPLCPSTQVAQRDLSRGSTSRRSPKCVGSIVSGTINEINTALGDWETAIIKDYEARISLGPSVSSIAPLRPLVYSPRPTRAEGSREWLSRAKLEIASAKSTDLVEARLATHMYNRYKRENGDF